MLEPKEYAGREQAYVKHFVLETYLQRLAFKLGNFRPGVTIRYVDGFSGPWQEQSPKFEDTSPYIALEQLGRARKDLRSNGKTLNVACMFIEKNADAVSKLRDLCARFPDVDVEVLHGEFESQIGAVVRFAGSGHNPFSFVFIDPTGWTGYGLKAITPLLQIQPGEVLINFMTKDIKRFIDDPESSALPTFVDLYGSEDYREQWRDLAGNDREDAIVRTYCDRIREAGRFDHCSSTIVLDPLNDRTHYHLVYATRSLVGLITFREVERTALDRQGAVRSIVRGQRRVERSRQSELFAPQTLDSNYLDGVIARHQRAARNTAINALRERGVMQYDDLVALALDRPGVSESTLKEWLDDLKKKGKLKYAGLAPRQRKPRQGQGHTVVWSGQD